MVKTFSAILWYNGTIKRTEVPNMDTKKVGAFLKQLRCEKGMTQEQLGEQLGVSNKTVSRWETGSYMPPVENLVLLSRLYDISINELLAGERVAEEKFPAIAEQNLTQVLENQEKEFHAFEKYMMWLLAVTAVLTVTAMTLLELRTVRDMIVLALVVFLGVLCNGLNLIAVAVKKQSMKK